MKIYFPGGKQISADYKGHTIETDQSIRSGGAGKNPSPFDLFKASLGTCMAFYVMAFCQERNIPLDSVYIDITFEEDHIIQSIHVNIYVDERFPEKYLKPIIRVTDACKIKEQLHHPPTYHVQASYSAETRGG
jgi:putative redox protein